MKPYPDYTAVSFYRNNVGTTNYQGPRVQHSPAHVTRPDLLGRLHRSKLTDIASSVFDASVLTGPLTNAAVADSHNLGARPRLLDGRHSALLRRLRRMGPSDGRGSCQAPNGVVGGLVNDWTVASFMTMQSGVPVTVTQANSLGYAGFTTQRPNLVGDPTLPADERTPARWFNTAAFATANQFTIGSASRNPVRGPSYHDVDLAVMRRVGLER
jgi:hypothetical protein